MARRRRQREPEPMDPEAQVAEPQDQAAGASEPAPQTTSPAATEVPRRRRFARVKKQIEYEAPVEEVREVNGMPSGEPAVIEQDEDIAELLSNPRFIAVVEREQPVECNGIRCEGEVRKFKLPKLWQDIVDFITETHGGGVYRLEIRNPRNGEVIAARQLPEIDGAPILPGSRETEEETVQRMFDEHRRQEESDPIVRLDREKQIAERELDLERVQQQLDAARERKKRGLGGDETDRRIAELEHRLDNSKLEGRLAALEQENKLLREQRQHPQPRSDASEVGLILKQMQADRQASDQRFDRMIQQIQNDKMDTMMTKLDEIQRHRVAAAPQNTLKEQVGMLKDLADTFGISLRGDRDEEEGDQPKEWYEILVKEHVPRILDLIESRKKEGKPGMTKEEFVAQMQTAAKTAEDEAVARAQARIAALQQQPPALPAGSSAAPVPAAAPTSPPPPAPVQSAVPSVEDEKKLRVGAIVAGFDRELEFRPRSFEWSYAAWQALPEEILEKVCKAPDPVTMLSAFEGIVIPEKLEALKTKLATNERAIAWALRGLTELKEWWAEALTDPKFDPADEHEEGGEPE